MAADKRSARLGILALVATILLGAIGTRLWFLQTVQRDSIQLQLDGGRQRTQRLVPERGRILDAKGRILADNRRTLTITIDRQVIRRTKARAELFTRLSGIVKVPVEEMEKRYKNGRYSNFLPLPIAEDVSEDLVGRIESRSEDFPGVRGEEDWSRVYVYAPIASHVIGYMGLILKDQADQYGQLGYLNNEIVGQFGVEKSMEAELHGRWGNVVYEVDSANRVVREVSRVEPVPGKDIQLTIDLEVQQRAELVLETQLRLRRQTTDPSLMAKNPRDKKLEFVFTQKDLNDAIGGRFYTDEKDNQWVPYKAPAGSVVVLNHANGQVVAMASYPTFDNRWFNAGLTGDKFKQLFPSGTPTEPADPDQSILVNRAIQGQYNLGSTFKPFVAYSAMITNIVKPDEVFVDEGSYKLASVDKYVCDQGVRCEYKNAIGPFGVPSKYGPVTVESALAVSSDSFFYRIGELSFLAYEDVNGERNLMQEQVRKFGFGTKTGIDLPFEFTGRVPDSALKERLVAKGVLAKGEVGRLLVGDNVQTAIGQGLLAASPLQLANGYAALANGGYLLKPHVVKAIYEGGIPRGEPGFVDLAAGNVLVSYDKPQVVQQLNMPFEVLDPIVRGLQRVVTVHGGLTTKDGNYHGATAENLFANYDSAALPVAGKTGTAQGFKSRPWNDSSAFAAFSLDPFQPYTVSAYLEKSGYGSKAAAPVVKCLFEALAHQDLLDPVLQSDPLDVSSLLPAPARAMVDPSCLKNPKDVIRD